MRKYLRIWNAFDDAIGGSIESEDGEFSWGFGWLSLFEGDFVVVSEKALLRAVMAD